MERAGDSESTGARAAPTGLVVGGGAGPTNYGILAQNREGLTTDLFLRAAEVQATSHGFVAESDGLGTMTVIADKVTSQTRTAVRVAAEGAVGAVNLTIGEATGGTTGIEVFNLASGFASIEATGIVTGLSEAGISVEARVNSTDIAIRADAVNGQTAGIRTTNFGTGDTNIVATGSVAAATGFGIRAVTGTNAANISITAVDVAGTYGIGATSDGTGSTSIVSTSNVAGFAGDAVRIENNATATDALVDVHNAEGALFGVQVDNDGTGATTVHASGAVTGQTFDGIAVKTSTSAQDVVVDAVNVTGSSGVTVTNFGLGSASVSATGVVTGAASCSIRATGGAPAAPATSRRSTTRCSMPRPAPSWVAYWRRRRNRASGRASSISRTAACSGFSTAASETSSRPRRRRFSPMARR